VIKHRYSKRLWAVELGLRSDHEDAIEWQMMPAPGPIAPIAARAGVFSGGFRLYDKREHAAAFAKTLAKDYGRKSVRVVRFERAS
jgi:hypothetical protein